MNLYPVISYILQRKNLEPCLLHFLIILLYERLVQKNKDDNEGIMFFTLFLILHNIKAKGLLNLSIQRTLYPFQSQHTVNHDLLKCVLEPIIFLSINLNEASSYWWSISAFSLLQPNVDIAFSLLLKQSKTCIYSFHISPKKCTFHPILFSLKSKMNTMWGVVSLRTLSSHQIANNFFFCSRV